MSTQELTSQELLERALDLLSDQYDVDLDSFLLVVTKDAKNLAEIPGTQIVVGEMEVRAVMTFIINAVQHLCEVTGSSPYAFISRNILGHFIAEERAVIDAAREEDLLYEGPPEIGLEDPEEEEARTNMLIYDHNLMDVEN